MDRILDKIAALGVPGLVLVVAMAASGWTGAAAVTAALATLGGPLGMIGGLGVLIVCALVSKGLASYGFEAMFKGTVRRLRQKGISGQEIEARVEGYPISKGLKKTILRYLEELG